MVWKAVTATNAESLTKQLTALTTAGFTIHTILMCGQGAGFTIVAWGDTPEKAG